MLHEWYLTHEQKLRKHSSKVTTRQRRGSGGQPYGYNSDYCASAQVSLVTAQLHITEWRSRLRLNTVIRLRSLTMIEIEELAGGEARRSGCGFAPWRERRRHPSRIGVILGASILNNDPRSLATTPLYHHGPLQILRHELVLDQHETRYSPAST